MKLPTTEEFTYKDCVIAGDDCWLITPNHVGCKWTDENARFRSCIVRKSDNFVVSQGFGKFTNFSEQPDFQPWDKSWKIDARMKLDGSLLIVSRYKGSWICRTRGTTDARQMANGHEIDTLLSKYIYFFNEQKDFSEAVGVTWLFEWVTPNNIIVLRESNEPDLILVGAVSNADCSYYPQNYLDVIGRQYGFKRPQKYEYDSIEECLNDVAAWRGKEGVVLYSPDGQTLKKIKASEYCELHKICTGIKNINQVVDLFMTTERSTKYEDFYKYIEVAIDFEVAERLKDDMLKIVNAYNKTLEQLDNVRLVVHNVRGDSFTRRDQAIEIVQHFPDWRKGAAFTILDNKVLEDKVIKTGIESNLLNTTI
jgi:hypothetical protein